MTIAFNLKSTEWEIFYNISDVIFLIDIVSIFRMSIPDTDEHDEIDDFKVVSLMYLRGWFTVDVVAIFPVDLIVSFFIDKGASA